MTNVKAVTATILAGAVSFALFQSSGSAQPNLPEAPGVQQNAEPDVQEQAQDAEARTTGKADVETKAADVDANAKAKAKAETTDRAESRAKNRANAQGEKARNKAQADAKRKERTKGKARLNADADSRGDAEIQNSADANLGFEFADDDSGDLTISAVSENSLATRAGLKRGDRIVSIDGRTFRSRAAMVRFLNRNQNRQYPITYLRNDRRFSVNVTPQMFARNRGQDRIRETRPQGLFGTTYAQGNQGVYIDQIHEGSPAHHAGLQSGDQIVCFNGWSYQNADQFETYLERFPRDRALPMTYVRDGQYHSAQVTLSEQNFEGTARLENEGRDLPPAPGPAYDRAADRSERIAEADSSAQRRTALRPNFDELSNDQLQQEVKQLRRENQNLRRQLNNLRQNRASDRIDGNTERQEATEQLEEAQEAVDEVEDARDIDSEETEVEIESETTQEVETP